VGRLVGGASADVVEFALEDPDDAAVEHEDPRPGVDCAGEPRVDEVAEAVEAARERTGRPVFDPVERSRLHGRDVHSPGSNSLQRRTPDRAVGGSARRPRPPLAPVADSRLQPPVSGVRASDARRPPLSLPQDPYRIEAR